MKNSKILKMFITILMVVMLVGMTTSVFADGLIDAGAITGDDDGAIDLTPELTPDTNTNTNNNTTQEESGDIPHAGVESSALMVSAFVIFGIVGVYTYIKLSDYSNI